MVRRLLVVLILVAAAAAKEQKPPQVLIRASVDQVKSALVFNLSSRGYNIVADTPYQMIFAKDVNGVRGAVTQVLMGNEYSDTPKIFDTFMFAVTGDQVLVTAAEEVSVRMPLGNTNRNNLLDNKKNREGAQQYLESLRVAIEAHGTPGIIGLDVAPELQHVGDLAGLKISRVTPGGPSESAGVKVGDLLTSINGKDTKSNDDITAAIQPLLPGTVAHMNIVRDGKAQEIAVEVWDRATVRWDGKSLSKAMPQ
jgi:membrane-associated protease RseP (regulator of RpoE activity)